jgi:hypothetical protein
MEFAVSPSSPPVIRFGLFREMISRAGIAKAGSDHHAFHVGSCLASEYEDGHIEYRTSANIISAPLKKRGINSHTPITGHHPTSHSEFMLLKDAPKAEDTYLGCNICFCPSCMKLSIIFGVNALVFDSRIFKPKANETAADVELRARFEDGWRRQSIPIARAAGMPVYALDPDADTVEVIVEGLPRSQRPQLPPLIIQQKVTERKLGALNDRKLLRLLANNLSEHEKRPAAVALARHRVTEEQYLLGAVECRPTGFTRDQFTTLSAQFNGHRYQLAICPTERLMMEAARRDLTLDGGIIACNFLPATPRQIDLVASHLDHVVIPRTALSRAVLEQPDRVDGLHLIDGAAETNDGLIFRVV